MENYTDMLRTHNLKATPQRLAILDVIYHYGHINIDKLYEEIKDKFSSISLATIYKNINAMKDSLLLAEVKLPDEKSVYEIIKNEHAHLKCNSCGAVVDINIDTDSILNNIENDHGFQITQKDIVLSGICSKCTK
jgi:Fur family peroxide stress response transcriptional regulator